MTISKELEAAILRYYHVERWKIGTIRRHFKVHPSTVQRVLSREGISVKKLLPKPSKIDPYLAFIMETLKKFPHLSAVRLYHMVHERGYRGSIKHFRHVLSMHRPRPAAEAFLRLKTLPGEQGQADWAHFGHLQIGRAKRPLVAFVLVLSFSRKVFVQFYLNQNMTSFLSGFEAAFQSFLGVPRVTLVDNLKSAVFARLGDAIHFNPTLLEFAAHYRFEVRPVAVARGNEKGRVERIIRFIRENFFAGRNYQDLDDLNRQVSKWCEEIASHRPCPEDKTRTVQEVFLQEQPLLLPLPGNPYPIEERVEVRVGKTPYVRYDLNDYSIPYHYVRRMLTVLATPHHVRVLNEGQVIAEHVRTFGKGQQIEDLKHIEALVAFKRHAHQHAGQNRLIAMLPSAHTFLKLALEKGYALRGIVKQLLLLLEGYGATELEAAVQEALSKQVPHPNAVRLSLDRRREERNQSTAIKLTLSDDERIKSQIINPHSLDTYHSLQTLKEDVEHVE